MAKPSSTGRRPAVRKPRAERLDRDERVQRILRAARDCFCANGYRAAVVSEISRQLGVSEATIFKYFPTKRELLNQVLEQWYGGLFGDYSKELQVIRGARNRFRYLVWRHLRTIHDAPDMCRLVFAEVRTQAGYATSPLHRMNLRYTGLFLDVVRDGMREGEFRPGLPLELLRNLVYGGIEHHAWNYLYGNGRLDCERIADQITDLLCSGISSRPVDPDAADLARLSQLVGRLERAVGGVAPER